MEDEDGDEDRSGGSGQRGPVRLDAQAGQQSEQNNDGQRRDQCGEPPMSVGVVVLRPDDRRHGQTSSEGSCGRTGLFAVLQYFFWRTKSRRKVCRIAPPTGSRPAERRETGGEQILSRR